MSKWKHMNTQLDQDITLDLSKSMNRLPVSRNRNWNTSLKVDIIKEVAWNYEQLFVSRYSVDIYCDIYIRLMSINLCEILVD